MVWIDVALKGAAVASTIIATLRAGSRAVYLIEHDAIGIMEGPLISPSLVDTSTTTTTSSNNNNQTITSTSTTEPNPLFELSEAFRHCVRLSIAPFYYENVQTNQPVLTVVEPYPLSPRPYFETKTTIKTTTTTTATSDDDDEIKQITDQELDQEIDELIAEANRETEKEEEKKKKNHSFFGQQYTRAKQIVTTVPSSVRYTGQYVTMTPKLASYWAGRVWYWKTWKEEETPDFDLEDGTEESDWDYNLSTEAQLRFNSTEGTSRVAEMSVFGPDTFQSLRSNFGISEESYRQSIFDSGPFVSFQSNSKGAARTGGVFFFTRDGAYMIKTIKKEEAKTFLKMLPKYHHHMKRHGRKSLLTRFCGMYGVRLYDEGSPDHGQVQTFIVMNAVFPAEGSGFISQRFDLKGSTVGREVSEEELKSKGNNAVLKDLDMAREVELVRSMAQTKLGTPSTQYGLNIGATAKASLLNQLREDVKLLVDCQVMDYSLLVGVVNMETHIQLDKSARQAMLVIQEQGRKMSKSKKWEDKALWAVGTPLRLLSAPPLYVARQAWSLTQRTVSSIITLPLPYYGSGKCGVDGGLYSVLHGRRNGERAVYYMGLIDFLQPWTTRKVLERKLKGFMGYDTNAISCVTPEEYAARFMEFLDAHVS